MPKSWDVEIPTFSTPNFPDGSSKPPYLIKLESIGTVGLTTSILNTLLEKYKKDGIVCNNVQMRAHKSKVGLNDHDWTRPEFHRAILVQLFGNDQGDEDACTYCAKAENGLFEGCVKLRGYADERCANCLRYSNPCDESDDEPKVIKKGKTLKRRSGSNEKEVEQSRTSKRTKMSRSGSERAGSADMVTMMEDIEEIRKSVRRIERDLQALIDSVK